MNSYDNENIELNISYNVDLASMYFDEWLNGSTGETVERIELGGRDNYFYLIGDSRKPYYKKSALNKMSKAEVFELWRNYDFGYCVNIEDYKKSEYISDLLGVSILRHYEYLASQGDTDGGIYPVHATCGYCQGDYAEYCYIGDMPKWYKKHIDNLFWDCPISGSIIVNDNEFYIEDLLNDCYDWNIDLLKSNINKLSISEYAKQFICDNLPDYPSYN
jgi:hypothetical protein